MAVERVKNGMVDRVKADTALALVTGMTLVSNGRLLSDNAEDLCKDTKDSAPFEAVELLHHRAPSTKPFRLRARICHQLHTQYL